MTDPVAADRPTRPPLRRWLAAASLAAAFVAGGVTLPLIGAHAQDAAMMAMGGGSAGMSGMHAKAMAHVSKMLDEVGASAEQKQRIAGILHDGMKPMMALHSDMGETHKALHALLAAPTIDREGVERLRATEIAKVDEATKAMTQALIEAAEVLTPEQRTKLASLMASHSGPS
jgi:Spy/CpxP family protein refolding chaperone